MITSFIGAWTASDAGPFLLGFFLGAWLGAVAIEKAGAEKGRK